MAFDSIRGRKVRSGLTVLGIVIGIAAIISLVSVGEGMRLAITEMMKQFGANKIMILPQMQAGFGPPVIGEFLTEKDLNDVKRVRGVEIAIAIFFRSLPTEHRGETTTLSISGVDVKESDKFFSDVQTYELATGRFQRPGDKYAVVIGHSIAKDVFSNELNLRDKLKIKDATVEVIGIMKEMGNQQDDTMIIMPLETIRDMTGESDEITMIFVKVSDASKADRVASSIQSKLDDAHGEKTFMVMSTKQITEQVGSITNLVSIVLGGIAAIALVVAGIGIANTMFMSIMERTHEIGIMKAIGATNANVMEIFLLESAVIGIIGGIIGCVIGVGMSSLIGAASSFYGLQIRTAVTPQLLLIGLGFSIGVGVISGLWPARRAAKLNPIEALRYE